MSHTPLKKAKPETRMFQSPSNLRSGGESISKDSSVRNGIAPNGIAPNGISPYDNSGGYGLMLIGINDVHTFYYGSSTVGTLWS